MLAPQSVENGQTDGGFDVVDILGASGQAGFKNVVSHIHMQGQPVGNQKPLTYSKIQRELVLVGKFHIAHADRHVQCRIERAPASEKNLAGKYVVAYVQVVIREVSPRVADNRNVRENILETGGACLGSRQKCFHENIFRHVVRSTHAVDRIGAKVLDAQRAVVAAQFEVFGLDMRGFDHAPGDLRLDDGRFSLRLFGNDLGRRLVATV